MCYRTFHRSSATHRGGKSAGGERIWAGRGVRRGEEHQKLAAELGCGCGWFDQWIVAGRRIHEVGTHAGDPDQADHSFDWWNGGSGAGEEGGEIEAGGSSLHGVQSLCAVDFAEQTLFLWVRERFHSGRAVGVWDDANDCGR